MVARDPYTINQRPGRRRVYRRRPCSRVVKQKYLRRSHAAPGRRESTRRSRGGTRGGTELHTLNPPRFRRNFFAGDAETVRKH